MTDKILVVDDERDIVDLICFNLEKEGFSTIGAHDGERALQIIQKEQPRLMILDLMLPGIQGMEICRIIRQSADLQDLPIIMLTAKNDELDRVLGLEMGADDYITKPFSVRELVARVKTILRRTERQKVEGGQDVIRHGGLEVDRGHHTVTLRGRKIELSPTEFKLLAFLAAHPGRLYTRDQLLDYVWGDEAFVEPRTVDVHIRRLRAQIEEDPSNPRFILTIRGFGYRFADIGDEA
ncbi:MAG: response regulator transcription factor [Deltaproteobacteria bacterium]|nr:response regulator transcription factor [Deltaproteobacteria bacterium]